MLDKTSKVNLIFAVYTTSVVLMLVSVPEFTALILDFHNGGYPPS